MAGVIGLPVSAAAFGFLELVNELQHLLYGNLPSALGFKGPPAWWGIPLLGVAGVLVSLTITYLPGHGGHSPADGFSSAATEPSWLPGVALAAVTGLALGIVLGPEAPLIAIGSGLAMFTVRLVRRSADVRAQTVVASAGSFAAVASILGSPLTAAFLLMEVSGLGGGLLPVLLLPGLLAAGVGDLVFIGLGRWTGLGTFSLAVRGVPVFGHPSAAQLGWGLLIGVAAAATGWVIRRLALEVRARTQPRPLWATPLVGIAVGVLALVFVETTGHGLTTVLFSGQNAVGPLLVHSASWTVPALLMLVLVKGLAYALSLSSFRGGPIFPGLMVGAASGLAAAHLPGMNEVAGVAMGMGAMSVAMLRLPLTAVLLPTLLLGASGAGAIPLIIVSVVVAYVVTARLPEPPAALSEPQGPGTGRAGGKRSGWRFGRWGSR
jgi:H+/Cl- antiporter ClcA